MIKYISQILLLLMLVTSCSKNSVQINSVIKPNKKYINELYITSKSETNIIADRKSLDMIESNGFKLPFITTVETKMRTNITTESRDENGEFFATKEYGQMTSSSTLNGQKSVEKKPYSGMRVLGRYDKKNEFLIDSIVGVELTPRIKYFHTYTIGNYERKIKSPQNNIKIGDTIKNQMQLNLPMQGMNPVDVIIYEQYILTEISKNKAIFILKQEVHLDPSSIQENTQIIGSGTGRCEYDINEDQLTNYTSELPMELNVLIDDKMTAKINIVMITKQNIYVE